MNQVRQLLETLQEKGVRPGLSGNGGLRVQGRKENPNDRLINDIRKHKEALIALLKTSLPFSLSTAEERQRLDGKYEDGYPISALQAGRVFHTQLEQFSGVYHDIMAEHVRAGELSAEWREARKRHVLGAICVLPCFSTIDSP